MNAAKKRLLAHARRTWRGLTGAAVVVALICALIIIAQHTTPPLFQATAAGLSAAFVCSALVVAVLTLLSNRRDRQTDRVHSLHQELTAGDIGEVRVRLGNFLRRASGPTGHARDVPWRNGGDPVRVVAPDDLLDGPLSHYSPESENSLATPRRDLTLLLRFFERARIAQTAGAVDDAAFCVLIGRHATWWDLAIVDDGGTSRVPLAELARWANDYAEAHPQKDGMSNWSSSRQRDFPSKFGNQT